MPRVRSRNVYQHVFYFDKGQIVAYQDCNLSYHSIAAHVGRDPMTVCRILNRWVQEGNADGSQRPPITSSREDRPQGLNGSCSHATSPESRIGHQDGRIRVRWYRGERTLATYIRHRHTGPLPGMRVWGTIGYKSGSHLVYTDGTFNSAHYISGVLRPVALPFIRVIRKPTFKQDNARPNVAGIVRTFLNTENVRLLPWPARSQDLSPIEKVWSTVAERLARHHTPFTTVDELGYRVEAAWPSVLVHAIQFLFDSIPRRLSAVITARGSCFWY
ncbi:uncharacterized protein TNCV_3781401 [Trichonephila clavipes]|nr:uncharacterized protein TNCV_3781401 [Trichonephila clavipes]